MCFPLTTEEVQACVVTAVKHGRPFVTRGSGTGLAGGAVPLDDPVVIVTTKMNRVLSVDPEARIAWVEPGVLNLDLSRAVAHLGLHFAPDPSSQQSCSIGGNVATNSGGPHCLAYGVTSTHILAVEVVLPDGRITTLGGLDPEPTGYDLRGAFIGGEGTLGVATKIAVRLTPIPKVVRTLLLDFASVDDGAATVSAIIAGGLVPAAIEMMDARITAAVEAFVHAGFPLDAAAVLMVEVDGLVSAVDDAVDACSNDWPRERSAVGASRPIRGGTGVVVEGPEERVRRDRAHQPRLLPPRHRGAATPTRRSAPRGLRDRRAS